MHQIGQFQISHIFAATLNKAGVFNPFNSLTNILSHYLPPAISAAAALTAFTMLS